MCNPLQKLKMKSLPTTGGETDLYSHPGKILLSSRLKTLADPFDSEAAAAADPTARLAEHSICLQPGLTPCAQHSFSHRAEPRRRRGRTKDPQLLKAPAGPACIWGGAGGGVGESQCWGFGITMGGHRGSACVFLLTAASRSWPRLWSRSAGVLRSSFRPPAPRPPKAEEEQPAKG